MYDLNILNDLSTLVTYPQSAQLDNACNEISQSLMGSELASFKDEMSKLSQKEKEELFTRTFDINGPCSLDIGYVIFGEDYKRGEFLVGLKDLYRRINYTIGTELADHLPYVLKALTLMPDGEEKNDLAEKVLIPAIEKMKNSLNGTDQAQVAYQVPLNLMNKVLHKNFIIG